jgi:methylthioribose-1-phosphate isomerase
MFTAMQYQGGVLRLIDQRHLPAEETWLDFHDLEAVALAIETMVVRGAPAIGCAAAYALALDANAAAALDPRRRWGDYAPQFARGLERLARTRPTAVNLFYALDKMRSLGGELDPGSALAAARIEVERLAQALYDDDLATCKAIGRHGADLAGRRKLRILTHCNAGALATAGFGTALGVIRALHERGQVEIVYADETRPWLQGSRLTAFELAAEGIPYRVIADSAAAYLMQQGKVDWAVVGADRIAANGDTANKIGTYSVAVNARYHGVELYVAAPLSTFDPSLASGAMIPVEERSPDEIRLTAGRQMTPREAGVWNPSFDVTPAGLISGIITEKGVVRPPYGEAIRGVLGGDGRV